jgi:peptide/nickel transport system substrate-binding protein
MAMKSFSRGIVWQRVLGTLASAVLLAAACGPAAPAPSPGGPPTAAPATLAQPIAPAATSGQPTVAPKPAADTPRPGGRAIVGSFSDAKVLSPVLSTEVTSADVWGRIYESLIETNAKTGDVMPRLAEKFEVSADNTSLIFTLRDGLKWSDGSAFSGEDFKFTVEAVMRSKQTVRKSIFQEIVGARDFADGKAETIAGIAVNGNAITVKLQQPFCPALINIGGFGIVPRSVFGKYMDPKDASKTIDEAPELRAPPLSLGPFKFKEWVPNDHITLVRNDLFWGQKAYLDEWVLKVYPDQTAQTAAIKVGEIDLTTVEPKDVEELKQSEALQFYSYPGSGYTYIGWNQLRGGKEFLQSKTVRQALAYGLNMDLVIEKVLFGHGVKQLSHTPSVSWAYDPEGMNSYPYDPRKAQQLLEQDGWTKGPDGIYQKADQKLEFSIVTNSGNKVRETILQVATEQYKQIGMNVTPLTESFEKLVERTDRSRDAKYGDQGGRDFDGVILGWSLGAEPDAYTIWHSSQIPAPGFNNVGYKSEVADKALEEGRTRCSREDRKAAYKTFNRQLNEDQPYNFGYSQNTLLFASKRLQGLDPGPFRRLSLWNVEKWWVKP